MRAVIAAAAAAAIVAIVFAATAGARAAIPIESTVQEVRLGDVGPAGASVGDTRSEILYLWNRDITPAPIGNAYLLCTVLGRGGIYGKGASWCAGVYDLPRGKLYVAGVRRSVRFYTLNVIAGTRLYRNATGLLHVRPNSPRFLETTFLLD